MAKIGYIRVSTADQNPDRQRDALQTLGVDRVFEDSMSGSTADRPGLKKLLDWAREGDTVYFESISRLARNTRDFLDIMDHFNSRGVAAVSLKEPIDTATPAGRMVSTIFAAMSEMEREYIRARQREGIDAAKKRGKHLGRPRFAPDERFAPMLMQVREGKISAAMAMRKLGIAKSTWYKLVKREGALTPGHRRGEKP